MDGGDADEAMEDNRLDAMIHLEVDRILTEWRDDGWPTFGQWVEVEEDPPLLEGEEEGEVDADEWDGDVRDIDLAVALRNFASPLRCMTVHERSPPEPCFGSIWYRLRRSNGRLRFPRLGYCFWTTQDRCDECGRPTCGMHGRRYLQPREIARRFRRYPSGRVYTYDFVCVHCWPHIHIMYSTQGYGGRMNYGGSIADLRGWTDEHRSIDPLSGLPWSVRARGDARALANDGIIDLTDEHEPEF